MSGADQQSGARKAPRRASSSRRVASSTPVDAGAVRSDAEHVGVGAGTGSTPSEQLADQHSAAADGNVGESQRTSRGRSVSSERRQIITTDARERYLQHAESADSADGGSLNDNQGAAEGAASSADTAAAKKPMSPAKKRALIIISIILAVAALSAAGWLVFFSQYCRVTQDSTNITGMSRWVDREAVAEAVDSADGTSIALVSDSKLKAQLSKVRGVASADITKSLPNKLTVTIHPQVAQAAVQVGSGPLRVVDEANHYLGTVSQPVDGIPVLKVDGTTTDTQKRALAEALKVLAQIPQPLRSIMSEASAPTQDSVTTVTSTGYTIIWGNADQMKLKASVAEHLIADTALTATQHVLDVSVPTKPIISMLTPQQAQQQAQQKAQEAAAAAADAAKKQAEAAQADAQKNAQNNAQDAQNTAQASQQGTQNAQNAQNAQDAQKGSGQ